MTDCSAAMLTAGGLSSTLSTRTTTMSGSGGMAAVAVPPTSMTRPTKMMLDCRTRASWSCASAGDASNAAATRGPEAALTNWLMVVTAISPFYSVQTRTLPDIGLVDRWHGEVKGVDR